jgi:hypothetical protein
MEKSATRHPAGARAGVTGLLLGFALAAMVAACAAPNHDSDPGELTISAVAATNRLLPQGGTYLFDPKSEVRPDPRLNTRRMDEMLRAALARSMGRRGFTPAQGVTPDLVVAYAAALGATLDDSALDALFNISSESLGGDASARSYEEGTLVVDLYDPFLRRTLWRGALQGAVTFDLPDDVRQKRLIVAVDQLMQRFQKE